MSISIDAFRNLAETSMQSKTVEVSQNRPGELKASGFWGRLFGSAGKDAAKNQQVMNEFCASIRETMGSDLEGVARTLLGEAMAKGRPLRGYMIRQVFDAVDHDRAGIPAHNMMIARHCYENLPLATLRTDMFMEAFDELHERELLSLLEKAAADSTAIGHRLNLKEMRKIADSLVGNQLKRVSADPGFMLRFNGQTAVQRLDFDLSINAMVSLRAVILLSGVRPGPELDAALALSARLMDRLSPPPEIRDSMDMLNFLKGVLEDQSAIFAARGVNAEHDVAAIFACAVQCALERANISPEAAQRLAENLFCGAPAREILGPLNRSVAAGSERGLSLKSVFTNLLNGFAWRTPMDPLRKPDIPLMSMERPSDPKLAAYLFGEGMLTDRETLQMVNDAGLLMLLDYQSVPGDWLVRMLESGGGHPPRENIAPLANGFALMHTHYGDLAAAQPDGEPFAPALVWDVIFHEPLPEGVSGDNLAWNIGRTMERKVREIIRRDNPDLESGYEEIATIGLMQASIFGLNQLAALDVRARAEAGARELVRGHFGGEIQRVAPPRGDPAAQLATGLELMALDLRRRGGNNGNSSITVGGVTVPLTKQDNPLLTNEADVEDYRLGRTENSVIRRIAELVAEQFGDAPETRTQRAAIFVLLSQIGTGFMRTLGPVLDIRVDEHSAVDMNLERLDDGTARLTLQTPPGAGHNIRAVYSIGLDGTARMTDIQMADFEG